MRILVTGIAGFIGYHCAESLLKQGHQVHGVDNLNDYYTPALKDYRLEQLKKAGDYGFTKLDLADHQAVAKVFEDFKPELVLHLAAQAGVRYSLINPYAYTQTNIDGTLSILEACRHHGKPRLVYASSSSVYGGNKELPFSETQTVDNPVSLYAATKKACELMAHTYTHLYDLQTVGLRFFTVYGPMGRPDMAMWLFTDAILGGRTINVFNNGDMSRDFTYIDDIVKGVNGALFASDLEAYEVFNLGNHRGERLMDLITTIEGALGIEAKKNFMPMQDGDVKDTFADITRAQTKLGFQPSTTIAKGIPRFVSWFKDNPAFHGPETTARI